MRRSLKKLTQNGEKRSQNGENLHKAIYVYPPKVFVSETLYVELPQNFVICFKGILAPLLLDTKKIRHNCLLLLNFKHRNSP